MAIASSLSFESVREQTDPFLSLFPHRFDYIYAPHPQPGEKPDWKTESRHTLSDRLIQQSSYLYGVRFGSQTHYCLLDIDADSPFHPQRDPLAIDRIVSALEPIGLNSYLACTSSYSGGLHLYFPFQQAQRSWELASAVETLLENSGFMARPGQLELFPNPKLYGTEESASLFNAHRLPMQAGSYLLNEDFQPIWSNQHRFVQQWCLIQDRNDVKTEKLKRILKQVKRKNYRVSGKAEKFINDLNAEIELGWTDFGQTNRLLGRIAMRAYVFNHILTGGQPLEGNALVAEIVATARSLPGYCEWCRHQHDIEQRATEWARCIENSRYFRYGESKGKYKKAEATAGEPVNADSPTWNQRQSESARERIRAAIADLLESGQLPAGATARFQKLTQSGIGGGSLYRHRDLWHPNYLVPPDPPCSLTVAEGDRVGDASPSDNPTSLFPEVGGNGSPVQGSGDRVSLDCDIAGGNHLSAQLDHPADKQLDQSLGQSSSHLPPTFVQVMTELANRQAAQEAIQAAVSEEREKARQLREREQQQAHRARMQRYLESGDPILVAEAVASMAVTGAVKPDRHQARVSPSSQLRRPPPRQIVHQPPDYSDTLAAISIELQRLDWGPVQVQACLERQFGKSHPALLDGPELERWWEWLTQQRL